MYVKLSVLQDVSRGVHYLHTLNPPVIHYDLYSDNILLTNNLIAKICDFGVVNRSYVVVEERFIDLRDAVYGLPSDVYLFGHILCHVCTQKSLYRWLKLNGIESPRSPRSTLPHYDRIQQKDLYFAQFNNESLKKLAMSCLNDDSQKRPPISEVCKKINNMILGKMKCVVASYSSSKS